MTYTMNDAYNDVKLFNTLAGNLDNVTLDSIDTQLSFCFEELSEAIESFEKGDMSNFVKEVMDMFVVTAGLMQKLQASGVHVEAAIKEVNFNNLTKFPKSLSELAIKGADKSGFQVSYNEQYNRWMIKDAVGKVRKPADYVSADMSHVPLGSVLV